MTITSGARALVTGGAGFIGSFLIERLLSLGVDVTVVDSFVTGRLDNLAGPIPTERLVVGDLPDILRQRRLHLDTYDFIFHLAANAYVPRSVADPSFDYEMNTRGSFCLLEAMRRSGSRARLVNISSAAVYGEPARQPITEGDSLAPIAPYGVSKLAAERYAAVYAHLYGLRTVSLRLFSVYGPRQRKQVVYDLLAKLHANPDRLEVLGDGTSTRDLSYVEDVVEAMLVAATSAPGGGEALNVASGESQTIRELVTTLCRVCCVAPEIAFTGEERAGDARRWEVNIDRIKSLGYAPRSTFAEGIRATKEWFDRTHAAPPDTDAHRL